MAARRKDHDIYIYMYLGTTFLYQIGMWFIVFYPVEELTLYYVNCAIFFLSIFNDISIRYCTRTYVI